MATTPKDQVIAALNDSLRPLTFSASGYIPESSPYTTDNDKAALKAIASVAADEAGFADEIERLVESMRGVPQPGVPAPMLAELNYLSFPCLLDRLIEDKRAQLDHHRARVELVGDDPQAGDLMKRLAESHDAHLNSFIEVRESRYKTEEPQAESA